jgi:exoribonuclease R
VLAICLGRFNGYEHYFTSSGKWFCGLGVKSLFIVNRFVEPLELEPVIAEIPTGDASIETLNQLQDLGHGPSRGVVAPLLKKMLAFVQDAEAVYQSNAGVFDATSSFLGNPHKHRYLTLHEIADFVLPPAFKRSGRYSTYALYAVHRSLLQDEVHFRPLREQGHRGSYLYEVSPSAEVQVVQRIEHLVHAYLELSPKLREKMVLSGTGLASFIKNARVAVDQSREIRAFSESGMVGPSKSHTPTARWSNTDIEVLQFIEMWASYQRFPNYSRMQTMGAAILRQLDRYQDAELLNATTGWTFLQEVGWIPPWEISSRYRTRFPDVEIKRGAGFVRPTPEPLDKALRRDRFEKQRRSWDGITAYCIDSESTEDIDDGVSVERTSNPEEHWIHVHVADPASSISPEATVAKMAELVPATIYLPGHFDRMLPAKCGHEMFSLGVDRPCLTFSALVNNEGNLLDSKITPGTLKTVAYMTPEDVNTVIEEVRQDPRACEEKFVVGTAPRPQIPPKPMTRPGDLNQQQVDELTLLARLGKAFQDQRLDKGATPYYQPRPEPKVNFDEVEQVEGPQGFISVAGDPSISISFSQSSGNDVVGNCMRLAGEVAAQWCNDRGIPIPYRIQPDAVENAALIQQYTRDVLYPLLKAGRRPEEGQWRHLRGLLGGDNISTTPGPHFTLGADMYTKATSPLRRFSDLIVHWQVEAALVEEAKRGKALKGNTDDSFLPFSRARLDRMLPLLRVREKQAQALSNGDGKDQWILQALVRAWRFKEAPLPETFEFTVAHVAGHRSIMGRLNWFDRIAFLRPDSMNRICRLADVKIGDVFRVKLKQVNVHDNLILVEALQLVERAHAEDVVPPAPELEPDLQVSAL